jgi:hypothetical protein
VVAATTVLAVASVWHSAGHVWRRLAADRRTYAAYSNTQRRQAVAAMVPLPGDVFDFYAARVRRGDRVYFLVLKSGFGRYFDLKQTVARVGRYYLLPATQTTQLGDATVVVSYFADPSTLGVHFVAQAQAGRQPIAVSRIRQP